MGLAIHHRILEWKAKGEDTEAHADLLQKHVNSLKADDQKSNAYATELISHMETSKYYKQAEPSLIQTGATTGSKTKFVICTSFILGKILAVALQAALYAAKAAAQVAMRMLPRIMARLANLANKFGQQITKLLPKNLGAYARSFVGQAKRFATKCQKNNYCKKMVKKGIKEFKQEMRTQINGQIKDKFQSLYDDLLGETCGTTQACEGNVRPLNPPRLTLHSFQERV